eukprot:2816217-Pleurochrysis_carterae.AAC.1
MASSKSPQIVHLPKFSFPEAMPIPANSGAMRKIWENHVRETISCDAPAAFKSSTYSCDRNDGINNEYG